MPVMLGNEEVPLAPIGQPPFGRRIAWEFLAHKLSKVAVRL
jgi:hypothetical protein